jgi:2-hydroxychromene-2-carboxylate isomerase
MKQLDLYIDFGSPGAYLAFKPTLALITDFKLDVRWLPYATKQTPIPAVTADENRGETHRRVRATARQQTHLKYAHLQNTPMHFADEPGNTRLAMAALLYVQERSTQARVEDFVTGAYHAYWADQLDLDDTTVITNLLEQSGYDATEFNGSYLEKLDEHQLTSEDRGVIDTPAYVIEEQVFIGREHLPWLREILKTT